MRRYLLATNGSESSLSSLTAAAGQLGENPDPAAALHQAAALLQLPKRQVRVLTRTGPPADEMVSLAEAEGYDLIAVGRRGLRPLQELMVGGVAQQVISNARCAVLVTHCNGDDGTDAGGCRRRFRQERP